MWTRIRASSRAELKLDPNLKHTKYWQAGYELGQELGDKETKEPAKTIAREESDDPLFLKDTLDGQKGDAQDEKDESAE